jgi:hypothetical protein
MSTRAIANGSNEAERSAARDANEVQNGVNLIAIVGCFHRHLIAVSLQCASPPSRSRHFRHRYVVQGSPPAAELEHLLRLDPELAWSGLCGWFSCRSLRRVVLLRSRTAAKGRESDGIGIGNGREEAGCDGGEAGGRGCLMPS